MKPKVTKARNGDATFTCTECGGTIEFWDKSVNDRRYVEDAARTLGEWVRFHVELHR